MNKCKTCKYWSALYNPMLKPHPEYKMCNVIASREIAKVVKEDMAFIPADFDDMPLMTRGDFGCVLHEPKD